MDIYDAMRQFKDNEHGLYDLSLKLESLFNECEYEKLMDAAERGMRLSSDLFLKYRELLLSLYDSFPDFPQNIERVDYASFRISIEQLEAFPAYRISMPFLLPNKRRRKTLIKTALSYVVHDVIRKYCDENHIYPFRRATVIYVSYYTSKMFAVDNDNLETGFIQNTLIGSLLSDDNGRCCDTIYYTKDVPLRPRTEIYVVDSAYDLEVYSMIKAK